MPVVHLAPTVFDEAPRTPGQDGRHVVQRGAGRVGIDTALRSCATQKAPHDEYLARRGRTWTDTWYMRPGFSEHQAGLAVDLLPIGALPVRRRPARPGYRDGRWHTHEQFLGQPAAPRC